MSVVLSRYAHYANPESQRLVELVGDLMDGCAKPEGWSLIHHYAAPPRYQRLSMLYWSRWWSSWKAWERSPSDWLIVCDGDVFPTRRSAMSEMQEYLCGIPCPSVVARGALNVAWQRETGRSPLISYDFGKSYLFPGTLLAVPQTPHSFFSFGLFAVHKQLVVPIMRSMLNFHANTAIVYDENVLSLVAPYDFPVFYFPSELVDGWVIEESRRPPESAFVTPSGPLSHRNYVRCISRQWVDRP